MMTIYVDFPTSFAVDLDLLCLCATQIVTLGAIFPWMSECQMGRSIETKMRNRIGRKKKVKEKELES